MALSGNFCVDKKASWLNFAKGRGKKVWADITINKKIVSEILHTFPERIVEVNTCKNLIGSAISGSLGFNAQFANIVASIFLSCGQDVAHVVEGSLGMTTAEVEKNGDLYFSIYMPDVICGTVGGGTKLATQKEALEIMQVKNANEFAEVLGGAVLAGELSLLASLAEGSLAKAHDRLGRAKK
jgi:hydroxymethylglutaryl-CoA reductase (NADPH)